MTVQLLVKDVMAKPVTISKSQSINEALDKMLDENSDPLIVLASHQVVGTISRKSIADKLGSKHKATISTAKIHVASSLEENIPSVLPEQEIRVVVPLLKKHKLVVVHDSDKRLIGQVGYGELLRVLQPRGNIDGVTEPAHTIEADERLSHLQSQMEEHNISRFVVMEGEKISGIVTETDLAISLRKFREDRGPAPGLPVSQHHCQDHYDLPNPYDRPEHKDVRYCQHDAEKKYQFNPGR